MNIVLSDPKTRKAFGKKVETTALLLNKKIGEQVKLDSIGLEGYEAKISGGSDKQGFPMRTDIPGIARKKIFIKGGIGFHPKRKGERKRVSVRGNTISEETEQVNLVITKQGTKKLEEIFGKEITEDKKEEKISAKEKLVKDSLENVGNVELAGDAKTAKGKIKKA
ncbi:MAG: 30S ribosomal protein S6e [Candidatus Diapherotrites archaeon CG10_big_fil_rev_8_21_14_0_10_31_34]|nr:MAG: 30S ribosomal protein S6e [Candidatus Diapherotrites archaeon CG10_big_fil_rev_8_21_14_0_10_31_34]PJA18138.1 MAG: 30S ribosomal protein S6e [Candidatus Diapherotrites archaeon CG_4_10_14_0_2_um_filter_31_5]